MSVVFYKPQLIEKVITSLNPPAQEDMVAWYRGDSVLSSESNVTVWSDKTGNGFDIKSYLNYGGGSASTHPQLLIGSLNGKNTVEIDNTSYGFYEFVNPISTPEQYTFSVVAVIKYTEYISDHAYSILCPYFPSNANFYVYSGDGPDGSVVDIYNGGGGVASVGPLSMNTWISAQGDFNGQNTRTYLNGTAGDVIGNNSGGHGLSNDGFKIGQWQWDHTEGTFVGEIAEIILYNRLLTDTERNEWNNYVSNYYGMG
jgi:hypothetical protein